jgi:hypothetical protein
VSRVSGGQGHRVRLIRRCFLSCSSRLRAFVPLLCPLYAFAVVHSMLSYVRVWMVTPSFLLIRFVMLLFRRTKLREMLGNENAHLYNSSSDGGRVPRRRSTTQESLPAVYLQNRNDVCQSLGPYASSRSLVGPRILSGTYTDNQGYFLDDTKDARDCEDPSIGRYRRVRDNSNHDSIIVLLDDPPSSPRSGDWMTPLGYSVSVTAPNTSKSTTFSRPDSEFEETRSFHGSHVGDGIVSLIRSARCN